MTVSLGNLDLGLVTGLSFTDTKRLADADLPAARGSGTQDLGDSAKDIMLNGVFTGASRFTNFMQLQRAKQLGSSLKLSSPAIVTAVFIREVGLAEVAGDVLGYSLKLKESLFKQVNSCDDVSCWWSSTSGAGVAAVDGNPTPMEGAGCVKVTHPSTSALNLTFQPADTVDIAEFDWFSFWITLNNVAGLTEAKVTVYSGSDSAYAGFTSYLTEGNQWLRIIISKMDFIGDVDWASLDKICFDMSFSNTASLSLAVDDVGGYE